MFIKKLLVSLRYAALVYAMLLQYSVYAQDDLTTLGRWIAYSDAPNALYHHLADEAYDMLDKRSGLVGGIRTPADWQQRQQWIRATLTRLVGPFPEKTPLQARVVRTVQQEGYRIEHIVFQPQPGFYVTSSLFLPRGAGEGAKKPAILYCAGHAAEGYRSPVYQRVILNLVKKGFIVFAFDPINQGERIEYTDPGTDRMKFQGRDEEHSYAGLQLFLSGTSLARQLIWDGIRAVDYLQSRDEVDPDRIGITGRSGGGTQSAYIAAFDERVRAILPENYITSFKRLIQSAGPQCAEQNFYQGIGSGIDVGDLLIAAAPRPMLVVSTTRDRTFSIQGAREAMDEVSHIYRAYGKEDNLEFSVDDDVHASTLKGREALYAFFQKHLHHPGNAAEEPVEPLPADTLRVSPTGQVATSYGSASIFSLHQQRVVSLENRRQAAGPDHQGRQEVVDTASALSGFRLPGAGEEPLFFGRFQKEGYTVEKYAVKGEGNYLIPYLLLKPTHAGQQALLYLHPEGKEAAAGTEGDPEWFVRQGMTVLVPDLIGTGETGPGQFRGDSYIEGISYNIWFLAMHIKRSVVGIRAGDVLRLAGQLEGMEGIREIYGMAVGEMGPVLLHAAAFDHRIRRVALRESVVSYRNIAETRLYDPRWVHSTVPGSIGAYDLQDLAASLSPRKLLIVNSTYANGGLLSITKVQQEYVPLSNAYRSLKQTDQLILGQQATEGHIRSLYQQWLK